MEANNHEPSAAPGGADLAAGASARDRIFLLLSLVLGFLLFELVLFEGFGISLPVYVTVFYAAVFWYLSGRPGGIDRRGLPLLVPIALLAACFALYDNVLLSMLDFLLLVALILLQLATMTGNRLYKTFSLGLIIDLFHLGVALPIVNVPSPFRALQRRQDGTGRRRGAGPVLIGVMISLPLLAVVLALLSSADAVFEKALRDVFRYLNENVWEYILKVVLGAIAAVPIFALLHALRGGRRINGLKFRIRPERIRVIDPAVACTVLALLSAVYAVFVAVQFGYLFNAFSSILPQQFTYAGYAQRGFFELMGVSVINLCVLSVSMLFSKRSGKTAFLKALEAAMVALTLLLIASAMAKMAMYMGAYGLTLLRVYVSWFLILLAVIFVAMLVKVFAEKFALTRFCAAAFTVLWLALNFACVDARVAQYNIDSYQNGKLKTVDVQMFYDLSDSMVPYAAALLDDRDPAIRQNAKELLTYRAHIRDDDRWQVFSAARENARRVLKDRKIKYEQR